MRVVRDPRAHLDLWHEGFDYAIDGSHDRDVLPRHHLLPNGLINLLDWKARILPCGEAARDLGRRRRVAFERMARWQR
jgi:hypothetical protein